jgi:DNA-binding phage protein
MEAAVEEGAAGVLDAMAAARLLNQIAAAAGVDRLRLCAALDGRPALIAVTLVVDGLYLWFTSAPSTKPSGSEPHARRSLPIRWN